MVAALIAALASAASFPPPVASFTAPASVVVGQSVGYADHSYDPAPGHSIVVQIWIGRASAFYTTGAHTVSLAVEDDRGLWGQTSRTIFVRSLRPPVATGAQLTAAPSSVARGDRVVLTLSAPSNASSLRLELPPPFTAPVTLPTGPIDYAAINDTPWVFGSGGWQTAVWVPWTTNSPADGSYTLTAQYDLNGTTLSANTSLTIQGTDRVVLWRLH
ncbi:MAG: hypothetical protein M0Z66_13000 [Thermaerobacter sp.]|nr:hypothetical protein [Thermaerobacter sp.]